MIARARTTVSPRTNEHHERGTRERIRPDALAAFPALGERPLVSVVVPALNEERWIGGLIDSFEQQTYPGACIELLIADGGSEDDTRGIVAERQRTTCLDRLELVDNPLRTTPHGLNTGVAEAAGEVVVIFGAHAAADRQFVEANVSALRSTGAAAVGGPIETVARGAVATAIAAAMSHPFGVGDARFRYATEAGPADTIAFAAYRRECFEVLGGFDPARVNAEDGHFNYRVRAAGGTLYLDPAIRSRYYAASGYAALWRQYRRYGEGKIAAIVAEPGLGRPRHFAPAAALAAGAALLALGGRSRAARRILGGLATGYTGLAAYSAWRAAVKRGHPGIAPLVAPAFPVMHVAYGVGSFVGLVRCLRSRDGHGQGR